MCFHVEDTSLKATSIWSKQIETIRKPTFYKKYSRISSRFFLQIFAVFITLWRFYTRQEHKTYNRVCLTTSFTKWEINERSNFQNNWETDQKQHLIDFQFCLFSKVHITTSSHFRQKRFTFPQSKSRKRLENLLFRKTFFSKKFAIFHRDLFGLSKTVTLWYNYQYPKCATVQKAKHNEMLCVLFANVILRQGNLILMSAFAHAYSLSDCF